MATNPTNNPIPSESPRDLAFNAGKIDEEVNSGLDYYIDRFGIKRLTNTGRSHQAANAIAQFGYITLDSFQAGAMITLPNQVLRDTSTGEYYRWDGSLTAAKVVPANSTPASTGGIGAGKWLSVGDASLRSLLTSANGAANVGYGSRKVSDTLPLFTSDWDIKSSNSSSTNATNLNTLIDYAISNKRLVIDVDVNATIDDINVPVRKKTEVFFRNAGGELNGLYRRAGIPVGAPSNIRVENGVSLTGMSQFYNATAPKVVIMGDSISTDGPNALSNTDSMASIISKKITEQNKDRAVDFINRAIGGQTWIHANTKPTTFPSWYADTNRNWLDYAQDQSPDLLILAFGMNDANGFNAGALHSVVNKVKAWSKVPSILFVTNPVPAIATTWSGGVGFYATIFQEGRDWAAGYARSYAGFYGYSTLDINRQFCLMRDGRDYLNVPLVRVGLYAQSYLNNAGTTCRDFSISGDISSWASGKVLFVKTGPGDLDVIYITNQSGNFKFTAFCTGQQSQAYVDITTSIPVTVGQTVNLAIQDNQFTLFSGITKVITFPVIRTGGEFPATVQWQDTVNTGPFVSVAFNAGNWLQCQYTARDSDIWGHDDGTSDTKLPEGGNGINHFSSKGLEIVVAPVVEAFDFARKVTENSSSINTLNTGVTASGTVTVVRNGRQFYLTGRLTCTVTTTPYKLFDLPVGYRPSTQKILTTTCINASTYNLCVLSILADGSVNLAQGNANGFLTLDGVSFSY